ncbi:unnamed protein product, partial [Polarella glacialis]
MGCSASVGANFKASGASHDEKQQEFTCIAIQVARGQKATPTLRWARTPHFGLLDSFPSSEGEGPPMQPTKVGPNEDDHEAWMQLLSCQSDTFADIAFQRLRDASKCTASVMQTFRFVNRSAQEHLMYIQEKVNPVLEALVTAVLLERPDDPSFFMLRWLMEQTKTVDGTDQGSSSSGQRSGSTAEEIEAVRIEIKKLEERKTELLDVLGAGDE